MLNEQKQEEFEGYPYDLEMKVPHSDFFGLIFFKYYAADLNNLRSDYRRIELDYDKVRTFLKARIPLIEVWTESEGIAFPHDDQTLQAFFEHAHYRDLWERYNIRDKREFTTCEEVYKKYPEIKDYYIDKIMIRHDYILNYKKSCIDIPFGIHMYRLKKALDPEYLPQTAPRVFSCDIAAKILELNIHHLIDYSNIYYRG